MGDAEDVWLEIVIGDDRDEALEGAGVGGGMAGQPVPVQILGRRILGKDL